MSEHEPAEPWPDEREGTSLPEDGVEPEQGRLDGEEQPDEDETPPTG